MFRRQQRRNPHTAPNTCDSETVAGSSRRSFKVVAAAEAEAGSGKVWLVGAGPGPADLLTLRAAKLLKHADTVIYDDLLSQELVDLSSDTAELIYVGKRGGQASTPQEDINTLLVEKFRAGKQVVRLKGGCCTVFSRARPEIEALTQAGCEVELVPGVSSALAGPLSAGVCLTDRLLSRHFAVTSAHSPGSLDWSIFKGIDTLVVLMGGRKLEEVTKRLQDEAMHEATTPVAVIRSAAMEEEEIWDGTLGTIVEKTAGQQLSPCIVIVGEVVRDRLR
ncbi:hypothetical protein CYMTET_39429 [Cymbomonas tetramitiformis]|uniref:uroporphyrinogen-III C-methyltransferase n=1 Tax=Cymbomonas tetramitiformis TaxID=36881 RepID=A0AAE0CA35_9CHLO|nr:hypothetical protein CYMTET_39429 [Cymbomonas tetramitiformis]